MDTFLMFAKELITHSTVPVILGEAEICFDAQKLVVNNCFDTIHGVYISCDVRVNLVAEGWFIHKDMEAVKSEYLEHVDLHFKYLQG